MKSYLASILSPKKLTHRNVSPLAVWDTSSSFTRDSEIRRFAKLRNSKVGRYSRVNPGCKLSNTTVGNFTAIGRDTSIGLGSHPLGYVSTQNIFYKRNNMTNRWVEPIDLPELDIELGSDVWVGVEALILDGVTIGDGAVVGARSVVTKDVPAYAVVAGVPAKVVKYRFPEEIIDRLLEVRWWDRSDAELDEKVGFFREPNVTMELLDQYFPKSG